MATPELYTKGAFVWVPDPEAVWISAQLMQDYRPGDQQLQLQLSEGRDLQYSVAPPSGLPPLGNPDILEGENDLTALSFLHEAAVLHNLRVRFLDYSCIYTYCGIVLVAINPYEALPIYGQEVIDAYSGQDMADMEPHIFSVAEESYRTMVREQRNQSIIISGESGSGKTVSAKFTMRYFAAVGGSTQQTSVEEKVLASNPIMEAIGNAKTTRNDNSSRFGKYIEIGFGHKGDIIGANMRTYLLEKSRVVFQATAERNYHIFYQLCASRHLPELSALKLEGPESFRYTSLGQQTHIPGTDDAAELERTRNALTLLGVQPDQQMELFRILAAVLHLGNVGMRASGRAAERSFIDAEDRSLVLVSQLLDVDRAQLAHWLCHRRLAVGGETLVKPLTGQQAVAARDALAKHTYEQLFSWTVRTLNTALHTHPHTPTTCIGVLDIYGFETFDRNSFEQFCINYANEKLQQQFNRRVFQLEQEEYEREAVPWSRVGFSDNQPCVVLLEGAVGLLDLLDEECRIPRGCDESWVRKLYDHHAERSAHFRKPRMSNTAFIILHFADEVQYECEGFLDKNRDTVFEEPINIMRASQSEMVAELFQQSGAGGGASESRSALANGSVRSGRKAQREHKLTVGFQFRQSLQLLMDTLNSTTAHYIRCIKPNDLKRPFMFDARRTVQQLRACGVLETIRISAAGYPSRWTYEGFFSRYRVLLGRVGQAQDAMAVCRHGMSTLIPDPEHYRLGRTKLFLRSGQVALLERMRAELLWAAAVRIQSWVRTWLTQTHYQRLRRATLTLQTYIRGAIARRLAHILRYTRVALLLQARRRMVMVRRLYLTIRRATITIQTYSRGARARHTYRQLVYVRAVVCVQATVRGWLASRSYRRVCAAVLLLQCCVRRRIARRRLQELRQEARSVQRYRELNKGMERKVMQLQLCADQQARECVSVKETLRVERDAHAAELDQLRAALSKLQQQLHTLTHSDTHTPTANATNAAAALSDREEDRRREQERTAREILQLTQELQAIKMERESLKEERDDLSIHLQQRQEMEEEGRKQAVVQANVALEAELEEERRRYQGLLREYTRLEHRYDNLRDMNLLSEHSLGHRRTDSSQSLVLELPVPPSPPPSSPAFQSPEEVRRLSVADRPPWSSPALEVLMEDLGVAKDTAERLRGEDLRHAYDAVRVANKFLETQLMMQRAESETELSALRQQLQKPRLDDISSPEIQDLQEQIDASERERQRLRRELRDLKHTVLLRRVLTNTATGSAAEEPGAKPEHRGQKVSRLLECRKRDEGKLIKTLITDLRGDTGGAPGLPAQLLFLCVRQADVSGEQGKAKTLLSAAVTGIKIALKKHSVDLEMTALWLKNSCLLSDLLTQHSPTQGRMTSEELVPLTFDLSEQSRALSDLCIQAYQQLVSITESRLQPIIVPALLESETIPGLSVSLVKRRRAGSDPRPVGVETASMAQVLRELGSLHNVLCRQNLPGCVQDQAFRQLTHTLCATALNSLLLRKDACCWGRGLQIRYNVSLLEEWLHDRRLQVGGTVAALEPLIQAAQLLQMSKKTEVDATALVQTCSALSNQQIVKILTLYTPQSDAEERVTLNFIRTVQALLKSHSDGQPMQLLQDVRRVFPVTFPYLPPPAVSADKLQIPESLKLSFLRRT